MVCGGALAVRGGLQGREVLDVGGGSGIRALDALKLGAARAVGIDNDPQALLATRDNADRNGVGDALAAFLPDDEAPATYPVVVANILASALDALADTLAARLAPGRRLPLPGLPRGQPAPPLHPHRPWFHDLPGAS